MSLHSRFIRSAGLVFVLSFSLSGPASAEDEAPAVAAPAPKAARREPKLPMMCPSEWAGNPEPVIKVSTPGQPTLLVCSERDYEQAKDTKDTSGMIVLSMFKVLSLTSNLAKPEVYFNSRNENELYHLIPIENGVQVSEQYDFRDQHIPLLSFAVRCKDGGCHRGKKVCVIPERAKNPFPKALAEWRKRIDETAKADVTGETPIDELVDQLFQQALTGDLRAFNVFDRADTPNKLPRDAKKLYLSHSKALKRAKQGGCFQPATPKESGDGAAPHAASAAAGASPAAAAPSTAGKN